MILGNLYIHKNTTAMMQTLVCGINSFFTKFISGQFGFSIMWNGLKQSICAFFSYLSDYLQIKLKDKPCKLSFRFLNHDLRIINHDLHTLNHVYNTCVHTYSTCVHTHSTCVHTHSTCAHTHSTCVHTHSTCAHTHSICAHTHYTFNYIHSILNYMHNAIKRLYKSFTGKHIYAKCVCMFIDYKQNCKIFIQFYSKLYDFYNKSGQPIFYTGFS